jgi:hypothetical protein
MFAGRGARRHNRAAHGPAFQDYVCFHGRIATRIKYFARTNGNYLSHIGPRNAVQQPVIQFGSAVHGKSLSGSALNRFQKLMHSVCHLSVQRKESLHTVQILANQTLKDDVAAITPAPDGATTKDLPAVT